MVGPKAQSAAGRKNKERIMDMGGLNWAIITIVGAALLAIVLFWAMARNKSARDTEMDRTEAATRNLYREEDQARDRMDDGVV